MKKLLFILIMSLMPAGLFADWIELYGEGCENTVYSGDLTVYKTLMSSIGIINVHETWADVPTADSDTLKRVDISTKTLVSPTSTWLSITYFTQPNQPRTLSASYDVPDGYTSLYPSTLAARGVCTIYGLDARGNLISDAFPCEFGNVHYSSAAFSHISSVTWSVTSLSTDFGIYGFGYANLRAELGTGVKIGLSNIPAATRIDSGNHGIYKIREGTADIAPINNTLNRQYYTLDMTTDPDGSTDYDVWYRAYSR